MFLRTFTCLLAACAVASRPTLADVLIGNGPDSPYMGLAHAIGVAQPGDVVLVKVAVNESLTVSKGVAIVADVPGNLTWQGFLHIQNVPAGQTLLLCGFNFGLVSSTPLVLNANTGAIRIQECGVFPVGVPNQAATIGVVCTASSDVAFLRCSLRGGMGPGQPFGPSPGATAISAADSTITIHDSSVKGGNGLAGVFMGSGGTTGTPGGRGMVMSGGALVLQSASLQGGNGGAGFNGSCNNIHPSAGGAGATGLVLTASATARAIGGETIGGSGGAGGVNTCEQAADGPDGTAVDSGDGTWTEIPGVARVFLAPRIVREGEAFSLEFAGEPAERAFLAASTETGHFDSAMLGGVLLPLIPFRRLEYGMLDAAGALVIPLTAPDLAPGATNELRHLQPLMVDGLGAVHLGCAAITVRLDAAF